MPANGPDAVVPTRLRVIFAGTPELAVPALEALVPRHAVLGVLTQPDRPSGRGRKAVPAPVKRCALKHGLAVWQPETLRDPTVHRRLAELAPDVVVVVAYGLLLPHPVLSLPRLGCVNVHASLLPAYRGASPIQAAILAGDTTTGVTTMLMDEGLDTGPILQQRQVPIRPDDTAGSLGQRLAQAGAGLLLQTLAGLAAGTVRPRPQDAARASSTRRLRKDDGKIDWNDTACAIERKVRAMQPWPVAFTYRHGSPLRIWRARVADPSEPCGDAARTNVRQAGRIVAAGQYVRVVCGQGLVDLLELQRPGGRRLPAQEFLRGMRIVPGERFGDGGS